MLKLVKKNVPFNGSTAKTKSMNTSKIEYFVSHLNLKPHPEGGYFKEVYRSETIIPQSCLPDRFSGYRNHATSIYFLLSSNNFSAFHRIKQDEIWNFHTGSSLSVHVIDRSGNYTKHRVGLNLENGDVPQLVVKAGNWFASSVDSPDAFALVGCTVAPGFDFSDFELADRNELIEEFPMHQEVITALTR